MAKVAIGCLVLVFLFGIYSCERWKYEECLKVGHSKTYCIVQGGKR